jgi:hypothetical protein
MQNTVREAFDSMKGAASQSAYEPPRITFDEILEVVAATCTGAGAKFDVGTCPSGPKKT